MAHLEKTTKHGLRLTPQHKIADSLQEPAQKAIERVKKALENTQSLDEQQKFLLVQMIKAAERLQIAKELEDRVGRGERLGFSPDEISGMNASVFLIDNDGWLQLFLKQAKEKLEGETTEAKNNRSSPSALLRPHRLPEQERGAKEEDLSSSPSGLGRPALYALIV